MARSVTRSTARVGQPPRRGFIEMVQTRERARVEQVGFDEPKWPFDLAFGFWPAGAAGYGLEAVMCRKSQKARVINGLFPIVSGNDNLHIIVKAMSG